MSGKGLLGAQKCLRNHGLRERQTCGFSVVLALFLFNNFWKIGEKDG